MSAHPTYPLQLEERVEIVTSRSDDETTLKIQRRFAKRRNVEFPNWQKTYAKEVRQWLAFQKEPAPRA